MRQSCSDPKLGEQDRVARLLPQARDLISKRPFLSGEAALIWVEMELAGADYLTIALKAQTLLAQARAEGDVLHEQGLLLFIGMAYLRLDQPRRTLDCVREIVKSVRADENKEALTNALLLESRALYALGRAPQARRSARKGLEGALAQGSYNNVAEAVLVVAADLMQMHASEINLYLAALHHDSRTEARQRQEARRLLAELPSPTSSFQVETVAKQLHEWLQDQS